MLIGFFVWVCTIAMGFFGYVIASNNWWSVLIKLGCYGIVICGVVILVQENGFSGIPLK
jgi:membrane protein YdbS with pleckstrin-like domain